MLFQYKQVLKIYGTESKNGHVTVGNNQLAYNCPFNNKELEEMGGILRRESSVNYELCSSYPCSYVEQSSFEHFHDKRVQRTQTSGRLGFDSCTAQHSETDDLQDATEL